MYWEVIFVLHFFTLTDISASLGVRVREKKLCLLPDSTHLRHWADFLMQVYRYDSGLSRTLLGQKSSEELVVDYLRARQH